MRLLQSAVFFALFLVTSAPALADASADKKAFRERQRAATQALVAKVKADGGGNYEALAKEVKAFKAGQSAENAAKYRVSLSTRDLDAAISSLRYRAEAKRLAETSATHLFGFAKEDVFDPKKVLAAFAKMPRGKLYRLPKLRMKQGTSAGALEVLPGKGRKPARNATLKAPTAKWHKQTILTYFPFAKPPAQGTVVMLWDVKSGWFVTAAGEVYKLSIRGLKAEHRGAQGGSWTHNGPGFVSWGAAEVLAANGLIHKKVYAKLVKANKAMWGCKDKVWKKANARTKAVNKRKLAYQIRAAKLKAIKSDAYEALDKRCNKSREAYNKALLATAADVRRARAELLKQVQALPSP